MSEAKYFVLGITLILLIGGFLNLMIGSFYEIEDVNPTGVYGGLNNIFEGGLTILGITIFSEDTGDFISDNIKGMYLANEDYPIFMKSIIIILISMILYGVIKALPTT